MKNNSEKDQENLMKMLVREREQWPKPDQDLAIIQRTPAMVLKPKTCLNITSFKP